MQGVLAARIDRLAAGRESPAATARGDRARVPAEPVRHVITQPEEELYRLLASLQRKEFLYEQPAFPEVEYIFKHALTQEVAYNSVLQERRKVLHERRGQAIEALYRAHLDDHYSELAHHYSRSGNTQKAVDYLQLAGQQAVQRSANAEAISHLTTALELLKTSAGHARAHPARTHVTNRSGASLDGHQGLCGPRSRSKPTPEHGSLSAGGGNPAALPGVEGTWAILLQCGQSYRQRMSWGAAPPPGPAGHKTRPFCWKPIVAEGHLGYFGELVLGPRARWSRDCPLRSPAAPLLCLSLRGRPGVVCLSLRPGSLGSWLSGPGPQEDHEALTLAQRIVSSL